MFREVAVGIPHEYRSVLVSIVTSSWQLHLQLLLSDLTGFFSSFVTRQCLVNLALSVFSQALDQSKKTTRSRLHLGKVYRYIHLLASAVDVVVCCACCLTTDMDALFVGRRPKSPAG
ncbi:unnamed protein product [Soboliphyme baturini]|uniref:Secreted protein n=1 Tax=Soboliphyme baturini TaxID=241478 RepID=A0A183J3B6_9BILA|nr:unnamed protein product [Soboliphyme baturini]